MNLVDQFTGVYGPVTATQTFFSPGRVNLIGEHIDYNGGTVLPAAISLGTSAVIALRSDDLVQVYSAQFESEGIQQFHLQDIQKDTTSHFVSYIAGCFALAKRAGYPIPNGISIYLSSNLPIGAGLSSSASVEVLILTILNDLFAWGLKPLTIAQLAQRVECDFVGVNCGIMDQAIIALGKEKSALSIQTKTFALSEVPVILPGRRWVIMNTNYTRQLTDSKYNERRMQCEQALKDINQLGYDYPDLASIPMDEWKLIAPRLANSISHQRAQHVISEEQRVHLAVTALHKQDAVQLGVLLNASHRSLRDDYQVTGVHLDALVNAAWRHGATGARMTGAGFGGCAIALVDDYVLANFMKQVSQTYLQATGLHVSFYPVEVVSGAHHVWHL